MAQPLPYNRDHNFMLDEEGVVNSQALNTEFDNASLSINALRSNLAKLQNDDGTLRAGVVGMDALGGDVISDVAKATENAAKAAEITLQQATATTARIEQINELVTSSANSVALMKGSVDTSEQNVSRLAAQVNDYSDELLLVADNLDAIQLLGSNKQIIEALAADLQGYPIYEFDGGEIGDPNDSMNGVGGVMKICADNIETIKQVAESLKNSAALMNLAETVDEIGSTDYVTIDETGNTGV